MDLKRLGEFGLIEAIRAGIRIPEGVTGIGDDCAVIPQADGKDTLVSTDMLIEGSHFIMDRITPFQLGWKSAAVNISDIAAMGGKPVAIFLSFALPSAISSEWTLEFMKGFRELSDRFGCPLLGGDTTSSPDRLCISVTVLGECQSGSSKLRSGAKQGDLICVTGFLGDSGGGLKVILEGTGRDEDSDYLVGKHYLPMPRVNEGMALASCDGVHAMMDISDGIGSDLRHILKASMAGARIYCDDIPISPQLSRAGGRHGWDVTELAVCGGEDYELLFTADPDSEIPVPHHVIGRIVGGNDIEWVGRDKDYIGFRHF